MQAQTQQISMHPRASGHSAGKCIRMMVSPIPKSQYMQAHYSASRCIHVLVARTECRVMHRKAGHNCKKCAKSERLRYAHASTQPTLITYPQSQCMQAQITAYNDGSKSQCMQAQSQRIPMHPRASGPDTLQGTASESW